MRAIRRFFAKLQNFFFRGRAERDLAHEIDAHLTLLQDDFERCGMTPEEARRMARRAYGGIEQAKQLHRDERSFIWLEQLLQDFRHACRGLVRNPGFTAVAAITLALGIGVNTALFSVYNGIALKPLPVADPGHVVRFKRSIRPHSWGDFGFSYAEYVYCRDHNDQFSSLAAESSMIRTLGSATTERLAGELVSSNYFAALGIRPFLGRSFLAEEDRTAGANPVVVISYAFWKRGFNGDGQVLGRGIKLNGAAFTVIGITPQEFTGTSIDGPVMPDFWAPLSMQAQLVPGQDWLTHPHKRPFQILGRLKSSTVLQEAQAQADLLMRQFATANAEKTETAERKQTRRLTLQRPTFYPNADHFEFHASWGAVMLIVGLVLFVACVNVGNMLLARGAARQREISTRLALGATRGRVIRQLLAESIVLSFLAGCAGLLISIWTTKLSAIYLQQFASQIDDSLRNLALNVAPDLRVVAYVVAVSLSAGIFFGLSPALQFTRRDLTTALKDEGASLGNLGGSRLRSFLIAGQVAVSMLLLVTAGLATRGLMRFQAADLGFDAREVFVVAGDFGERGAAKAFDRKRLLAERLRDRREFADVTLGGHPLNGGAWVPPIIVGHESGQTLAGFASDAYMRTLGIPLIRGRTFTSQETAAGAPVAMISVSAARSFWPNEDPLGKHFTLDMDFRGMLANFEVIGIVKDIRFDNPTRIDPAHVYLTAGSRENLQTAGARGGGMLDILLRVQGDCKRALAAVESVVAEFDKDLLPSLRVINLEEGEVRPQVALQRWGAILAAILALLAVTLAGVGIYGVIAYLVSQRTREIGIRIALGATSRAVLMKIVLQGLRPVFEGMILGLAAAGGISSVLHWALVFPETWDFLNGVSFYDPVTFIGLSAFIVGIAALASAIPARRALTVDPMTALRYE